VTINSQQYSNGGVNPATFAPFTDNGVGTQAYTLSQALNPSGNPFGPVPNPLNMAAQTVTGLPLQSSAQVGSSNTFSGVPNESGAAQGASTGTLAFSGFGQPPVGGASILETALAQAGINPALAHLHAYDAIINAYEQRFAIPSGGWGPYFEAIGIPKVYIPSTLYNPGYVTTGFAANFAVNPDDLLGPTPSTLIPSTPTPSYNTGGGSFSSHPASVTVNALNPSSRGVVDGIVTGLRQIGVKVA